MSERDDLSVSDETAFSNTQSEVDGHALRKFHQHEEPPADGGPDAEDDDVQGHALRKFH